MLDGDCVAWARSYEGPKFHALLSDPPYHLTAANRNGSLRTPGTEQFGRVHVGTKGFMGKDWDGGDVAFDHATWAAFLPLLHPGAFGMAFASSRGWHRLACAIEDAGYIIHPSIFGWLSGQGFPKATRIDTAIDKAAGAERTEVVGVRHRNVKPFDDEKGWNPNNTTGDNSYTAPATPLARAWSGHRYGLQALKPALEPIIVFQKPYEGKPVDCITHTGAGALNVDGGRIAVDPEVDDMLREVVRRPRESQTWEQGSGFKNESNHLTGVPPAGRWPANFVLSESLVERLDAQAGERGACAPASGPTLRDGNTSVARGRFNGLPADVAPAFHADSGGASRFYFRVAEQLDEADPVRYCAKASRAEREAGLEDMPEVEAGVGDERPSGQSMQRLDGRDTRKVANHHPCIKPLALTRWLATLLLPPAEYAPRRVFVPFAGVASEVMGAMLAGFDDVVGVEREAEYCTLARARLAAATRQGNLPL